MAEASAVTPACTHPLSLTHPFLYSLPSLRQCLAELDRVQKQLHRAQDSAAALAVAAEPVLELRRQQAAWDAAHEEAGRLNALARIGALRRLGARPHLTL